MAEVAAAGVLWAAEAVAEVVLWEVAVQSDQEAVAQDVWVVQVVMVEAHIPAVVHIIATILIMVATLIMFTAGRSIAAWINNNELPIIKDPSFAYFGNLTGRRNLSRSRLPIVDFTLRVLPFQACPRLITWL